MSEKQCTVCRRTRQMTDYSPCRNGYQPSCRECRNHKAASKCAAVTVAEQKCRSCHAVKEAAAFNRSAGKRNGLQSECKACANARKSSVNYPVSVSAQVCRDCGIEKPASEYARNKKLVSGIRRECRDCTSLRNRSQIYAVSLEAVREMCRVDACEICGSSFATTRDRNIDHCHATGKVRGVLCNMCNRMLGSARDKPSVLEAAAMYLRANSTEASCA